MRIAGVVVLALCISTEFLGCGSDGGGTAVSPIDQEEGTEAATDGSNLKAYDNYSGQDFSIGAANPKDYAFCAYLTMSTAGETWGEFDVYNWFEANRDIDFSNMTGTYSGDFSVFYAVKLKMDADQVCFKTEAQFPTDVTLTLNDATLSWDGLKKWTQDIGTVSFNQSNKFTIKTSCLTSVKAGTVAKDREFWDCPVGVEGWNPLSNLARIKVSHKVWVKLADGRSHAWTRNNYANTCNACMVEWFGCD